MKKKRTISLKAVQAALRSPKTPEHLRTGLLKKYGHLSKNAPKEWHEAQEKDSRQKAIDASRKGDTYTAEFYRGSNYAHKLSKEIKFKNPKESTDGYISERIKSPKKFDPRSFRTKRVDSTLLTFGCPKGKWSPKKKKCKVPVELQRKLKVKRSNPAGRSELIYDKVLTIQAQKGKGSHWPNEKFEHKFTSGAKIYGLSDGSLLIKGKKPLWSKKRYSEKNIKELNGKI